MPMATRTKTIFVVLLWSCICSAQELVKEPAKDNVVISEHHPGLRLVCYINKTSSTPEASSEASKSGESSNDDEKASKIKWFHSTGNPDELTEIDEKFVKTNEAGHSILAMSEGEAKDGLVTCRMEEVEQSWRVAPHFQLVAMPASKVVVAGEDVTLHCRLRDRADQDGELSFTWYRIPEEDRDAPEGEVLVNSTAPKDEIDPHIRIVHRNNHSILKIEDAVYGDRSVYRCTARLSKPFQDGEEMSRNATTQTLLRIKDKYAALYPFLGIVGEVLALALIIFICERRKSSDGDDDDDDDDDNYNSAPAGNGNSKLRRRN